MSELNWALHDLVRKAADEKYTQEVTPDQLQEYDETMTNMGKAFRSYGMDLDDPTVLHTMYGMLSVGTWLMMQDMQYCRDPHALGHVAAYAASVALFLREQAKYADLPAPGA